MAEKSVIDWIAAILVVIGALNWGLVGLFELNIVESIFGSIAWLATVVYVLVALAGIWVLIKLFK